MGGIFNTPGTLEIIDALSGVFTNNFATAANNGALKSDLGNKGMPSRTVASNHNLNPHTAGVIPRWHKWLDFFDGKNTTVRDDMAATLNNPAKYEAIEFFAFPDPNFGVTFSDVLNPATNKYSRIISVRTPTIDSLP